MTSTPDAVDELAIVPVSLFEVASIQKAARAESVGYRLRASYLAARWIPTDPALEGGSAIIGTVGVDLDVPRRAVLICSIFVIPGWRRRGVMRRLVAAAIVRAEAAARGAGFSRLVAVCTPASIDHFLSLGFTVRHRYKAFTRVERAVT